MRRVEDRSNPSAPGALSGESDVRLRPDWKKTEALDVYSRATDADDKTTHPSPA